jgi:hypothetical protein
MLLYGTKLKKKKTTTDSKEQNNGHNGLTYASEISTLTTRDRKQLNIFERKVYRRILGPIYDNENENENWRILTNIEIYAILKKKTYHNRDNKATQITFVHVQRVEKIKIPKRVLYRVLYINLESTRPRDRPRHRRQDEVRVDDWWGRVAGKSI